MWATGQVIPGSPLTQCRAAAHNKPPNLLHCTANPAEKSPPGIICCLSTYTYCQVCTCNDSSKSAHPYGVVRRLTSNSGPEEDEGQAECAILLLDLPCQHHKEQHVGQHMLEAGVDQDTGHPPVPITVTVTSSGENMVSSESQNPHTEQAF